MENWPNIPLPSACPSGIRDPLLEDEFQSGDDAARPQFAAPRCLPITLSWNWMHKTHLATLRTFQKAHRADLFLWEDPFTGEQWEARFAGEEPVKWSPIAKLPDYAQVTATIKPVNEVVLPADAPVTKRKPSYILSAEIGLSSEIVQRDSEQAYRRENGSLGVMPANTLVPTVKNGRKCFEVYEASKNLITNSEDLRAMNALEGRFSKVVPLGDYFDNGFNAYRIDKGDESGSILLRFWSILQKENVYYTTSFLAHNPTNTSITIRVDNDHSHAPDVILAKDEKRRLTFSYKATAAASNMLDIQPLSEGIVISETQIEEGEWATAYIPPNANGNVRGATNVIKPAGNWFNPLEGTFVVEFNTGVSNSHWRRIINLNWYKSEHGNINVNITPSDSFAISTFNKEKKGVGGLDAGKVEKCSDMRFALKYTSTYFSLCINGNSPIRQHFASLFEIALQRLCIGTNGASSALNSHIYSLIYYPEAVTDEELQAFSEVRHA